MPLTFFNTRGDTLVDPGWHVISKALYQLFGAKRPHDESDEYVILSDDAGNELQISSKGTVRLTYAETADRELGLHLGDVGAIQVLCQNFAHGNFDALRAYPWEIEIAPDEQMEPDLRNAPAAPTAPAFVPLCLRCEVPMRKGILRSRYGLGWSELPLPGAIQPPRNRITTFRCPNCGHLEIFAH